MKKISRTIKKLSAFVMVFAMLLGVFGISGKQITANAAVNPVKMYYCDNVINWRGSLSYNVYIQIDADSAANKEIYVHHSNGIDAEWVDTKATYVAHLDNNTEIWKASVSGFAVGKYVIKYVGDGQIYWDNNNGNNYTADDILGQANVEAERLSHQPLPESYTINAIVKNLAYTKTVTVRYTQDNWATYKEASLSYNASIFGTNFERWSVTLNLDENKMDSFEYCIRYEVNGQTYWDSNFGANYDNSYYSPL